MLLTTHVSTPICSTPFHSPLVYILENTYPGEKFTEAVKKAGDLVQAFVGAPVVIDAVDLGAAAHRV